MKSQAEAVKQQPIARTEQKPTSIDSILAQANGSIEKAHALQERKKVLIVDDNGFIRDMLTRFLTLERFNVVTAIDGRDGVDMAEAEDPDCIIADINMPHLSGSEMIKILRRDPKFQQVPIVAITAYGHLGAAQAMEAGANLVMLKPLEPDELIENLRRLLEKSNNRSVA